MHLLPGRRLLVATRLLDHTEGTWSPAGQCVNVSALAIIAFYNDAYASIFNDAYASASRMHLLPGRLPSAHGQPECVRRALRLLGRVHV